MYDQLCLGKKKIYVIIEIAQLRSWEIRFTYSEYLDQETQGSLL